MVGSALLPTARDAERSDLVLRICGSRHDGQIVRLRSTKCTIGQGRHCTLRLVARGLWPVHCLIVRGTEGAVVRRWSTDTRLNGRDFVDADLRSGDRLSIGHIDLEVVQPGYGEAPMDVPAEGGVAEDGGTRGSEQEEQGDLGAEPQVEPLQRDLDERQRCLQEEQARLEEGMRQQSLEIEARRSELDARQAAWDAERRQWEADRQQWEVEREAAERELRRRAEELTVSRCERDAQREPSESPHQDEGERNGEPSATPALTLAEDEDESIDAYMEGLMNRVRAAGGEPVPTGPPSPRSQGWQEASAPEPVQAAEDAGEGPSRRLGGEEGSMTSRPACWEKRSDLSAMREVAKLSAKSALDRHSQRRMASVGYGKLWIAVLATLSGSVLAWTCWRGGGYLSFVGAIGAFAVALRWGLQYLMLRGGRVAELLRRLLKRSANGASGAMVAGLVRNLARLSRPRNRADGNRC